MWIDHPLKISRFSDLYFSNEKMKFFSSDDQFASKWNSINILEVYHRINIDAVKRTSSKPGWSATNQMHFVSRINQLQGSILANNLI